MIINTNVLKQVPLAEGGEGFIYELKDKILKVYKDSVNKPEKEKKIQLLMSKSLPSNVISPTELAYDRGKKFIGYIMPKVEGEDLKKLGNKKYVKINNITNKDLIKLATKIKETLVILHSNNILISDLNDSNIIFDKDFNPYFIDVDSWSVENIYCTVCMETFKDPLMKSNNFTKETDYFSFSVLLFKMLTRLHPFGGTMNPDIDILQRISKRISVIDNSKVNVPPTINKWNYISPKLLSDMKSIFEKGKRFLIDDSLMELANNLKLCLDHKDYYYGKFTTCPVCNSDALVIQAPIKIQGNIGDIPYIIMVSFNDIKTILTTNSYLDINDFVVHSLTKKKVKYISGNRYYFSNDGENLFTVYDREIVVNNSKGSFKFEKINKSPVLSKDNEMYYINNNCNLTQLKINNIGNSLQTIAKTSFNAIFEVVDINEYFVCNIYDGFKIINVSGYNYTLNDDCKIINYGIHHDNNGKKWLFIIENDKGNFQTYVFDKNKLVFSSDTIKYSVDLSSICFSNGVIFRAGDGYIKGFNYISNSYKDFPCKAINDGSRLIREGSKFIVLNDKEIIKVG